LSLSGAAQRLLEPGGFQRWFSATVLFSVAAVVQTWPLVLHTTDSIVDVPEVFDDSFISLWHLWWFNHALVDLHTNPLETDLLFFPGGVALYLSSLQFVSGALSMPLQWATGNVILSWNVLGLVFFVLSALGMYALSYRVNRNHAAALVSGYIFAFAPFILMQFHGRWHLSTTWPIPLLALFLIRFQDAGRLREAVAAAIFWALLTYNSFEYGAWAGLFLGLFVAYWSLRYLWQRDRERLSTLWRGFAVTAGVWLIVTAPLLIPTWLWLSSEDVPLPQNAEFYSSDLTALVTPSSLWGPGESPEIIEPGQQHQPAGSVENTVYLGIVPLLLAGMAIFTFRRRPDRLIFWSVVFLFFTILALGPYLFIGDTKDFSVLGVSFSVPLPYWLYQQVPLVGSARVPARMIVFGIVGLAVLAGAGFEFLTSWLRRRNSRIMPLAALVIASLVVLEFWSPPVNLVDLSAPAVFEEIRDEPGDFTVLHAPWGRSTGAYTGGYGKGAALTNYYQTIHEKPSFGGLIGRASSSDFFFTELGTEPGLGYLTRPPEDVSAADQDGDEVRRVFQEYRIKYVVLHRFTPKGEPVVDKETFETFDLYLRSVPDLVPIFTDASLIVYRNPDVQ
jgi:hypothetical protein